MPDFNHRSTKKELLDASDIPFEDIQQNLIELDRINTLLGGHQMNIDAIKKLIPSNKDLCIIAEIGCGGGDNLRALSNYLNIHNIPHHLIGIDMKPECIEYAKKANPTFEFICSDYQLVEFKVKPDIIFSSLFCHHFEDKVLPDQLIWMKHNSKQGFFINDLQRNRIAYYAILILTTLFSRSYLVKNDAPLSVLRSFHRKDWRSYFALAKISTYNIHWRWAFRYLIHFQHGSK